MNSRLLVFLVVNFTVALAFDFSFLSNKLPNLKGVVKNEGRKLSNVISEVRSSTLKKEFLSAMLLRGQPIVNYGVLDQDQAGGYKGLSAQAFNWTSCGPANQLIDIKDLSITPAPLSFPGALTFAFNIVFHNDIDASENITAQVELKIKAGDRYIRIPCIGQLGSCTYTDLCSILDKVTCPQDLEAQGIPCKCPFKKGQYKLQKYKVEIDAEVFIPGSYMATAKLTSGDKGEIGCYVVHFIAA